MNFLCVDKKLAQKPSSLFPVIFRKRTTTPPDIWKNCNSIRDCNKRSTWRVLLSTEFFVLGQEVDSETRPIQWNGHADFPSTRWGTHHQFNEWILSTVAKEALKATKPDDLPACYRTCKRIMYVVSSTISWHWNCVDFPTKLLSEYNWSNVSLRMPYHSTCPTIFVWVRCNLKLWSSPRTFNVPHCRVAGEGGRTVEILLCCIDTKRQSE